MKTYLNIQEKRELSEILKYCKENVEYVSKEGSLGLEFIKIEFKNGDIFFLDKFYANSKYKNMELRKKYTLRELNI